MRQRFIEKFKLLKLIKYMERLNLKELDGTAVEEIVAKPMSKLHP